MKHLNNPLLDVCYEFGNATAFLTGEKKTSYKAYSKIVELLIYKLKDKSIIPGSKVAFVSNNTLEEVFLLISMLHVGAIGCPLSKRYPKELASKILSENEIDVFIEDVRSFCELPELNYSEESKISLPEIDPEKPATIIFTSGSSSIPKGVVHTFANHYYSALGSNENISFKPNDRWLLSLPFYHVGGIAIIFRALLSGGTIVIPDVRESLIASIGRYNITHLSLVAAQFQKILESGVDLSNVKAMLLGGGKIPVHLLDEGYNNNLPLYTSYGLSEMASQVTTIKPGDNLEKLKTSGEVLNYRQIKIDSDNEILVKGETLFNKYSNSDFSLDYDGWFHTGDLGRMDDHGYLNVLGRKDNMFISGGENIFPEEIESAYLQNSDIEAVVVAPVLDETYGERPVVFLKYKKSSGEVVIQLDKIEKFKIPIKIFDWPKKYNQIGFKIDRSYFKDLASKLTQQ